MRKKSYTGKFIFRDIKHQNVMIESSNSHLFVKLIDFGFAKLYNNQTYFNELKGTPLYMAPEILKNKGYNHKVDIWSCGIMLQMMLTGDLPFQLNTNEIFCSNAKEYAPTESSFKKYEYLSQNAINFLLCCLNSDPNQRSEAIELLEHDWIKQKAPNIDLPIGISMQIERNLSEFNARFKLEQAVYTYLATNAICENEKSLRQMFLNFDTSKDGLISKDEFISGMKKIKSKVGFTEEELIKIFEEMDADYSGSIDYTEFIRAAMDKAKVLTDKNLRAAFNFFDVDHNGQITKDEIKAVFAQGNIILDENLCNQILDEVDSNHDETVLF